MSTSIALQKSVFTSSLCRACRTLIGLLQALHGSTISPAALSTLTLLAAQAPDVLAEHLASIVPQLLLLTKHEVLPWIAEPLRLQKMLVRVAALETLSAITALPTHRVCILISA